MKVSSDDCWALLSSSTSAAKAHLIATLRGYNRAVPRAARTYPILDGLPPRARPPGQGPPREPEVDDIIQYVHFRTRLSQSGTGFQDYTARYYAIRDEDKVTLRESLKSSMPFVEEGPEAEDAMITEYAAKLRIDNLLDMPLVTLSNGQNRRASILRGLLTRPELIILEEPFTGLDAGSRQLLTEVCHDLHTARRPRILFTLRPQDEIPSFVTHIALLGQRPQDEILSGPKGAILETSKAQALLEQGEQERRRSRERQARLSAGKPRKTAPVIELKKLNVAYGIDLASRPVLQDIDWTVRQGERWVLAGHNGSGKSTLLSVILGDHPRSYTEDVRLFDKPRDRLATVTLHESIGHASPEIFNAFPRSRDADGLTAREAIGTGFASIFSWRRLTADQDKQIDALLTAFDYDLLRPMTDPRPESFENKLFADLAPGEQSLVLLLRALVKEPPLVILDEPFAGMDAELVQKAKHFLDTKLQPEQAAIFISHFEEEIPDTFDLRLTLESGKIKQISS